MPFSNEQHDLSYSTKQFSNLTLLNQFLVVKSSTQKISKHFPRRFSSKTVPLYIESGFILNLKWINALWKRLQGSDEFDIFKPIPSLKKAYE